jgi:hypothetical protein
MLVDKKSTAYPFVGIGYPTHNIAALLQVLDKFPHGIVVVTAKLLLYICQII